MSKHKKIIIAGACLFLIFWAGLGVRASKGSDTKAFEVIIEDVKLGDLTSTISASGSTKAQDLMTIRAEFTGQINEILVKERQEVRKGQVLVRFNDQELKQNLRQAENELNSCQTRLSGLTDNNGQKAPSILRAEHDLAQVRVRLQEAETDFNRQKILFEQGAVSQSEYKVSESEYKLAGLEVQRLQAAFLETVKEYDTNLTDLTLKLRDAQKAYSEAKQYLEQTELRASRDGMVLSLPVEAGVAVAKGDPIITMGRPEKLLASFPVNETDILKIKTDQKVKIRTDALPDVVLSGKVIEIALQGGVQNNVNVFPVKVLIDNTAGCLLPGMSVDGEIITDTVKNGLIIPLQAILEEEKGDSVVKYLFLVKNGKAQKTYVNAGLSNESKVQVISGIKQGNPVITGDLDTLVKLKDGDEVRAKK